MIHIMFQGEKNLQFKSQDAKIKRFANFQINSSLNNRNCMVLLRYEMFISTENFTSLIQLGIINTLSLVLLKM